MNRLSSSLLAEIANFLIPDDLIALCNCNRHLHSQPDIWTDPSIDFTNRFLIWRFWYPNDSDELARCKSGDIMIPQPYARMIFSYKVLYWRSHYGEECGSCEIIQYVIRLAIHHGDPTILYRYTNQLTFDDTMIYDLLGCVDYGYTFPEVYHETRSVIDAKVVPAVLTEIFDKNNVLEAKHFAAVFVSVPHLAHVFVPILLGAYKHMQISGLPLLAHSSDNLEMGWETPRAYKIPINTFCPINEALFKWRQESKNHHKDEITSVIKDLHRRGLTKALERFIKLFVYHDNVLEMRSVIQKLTAIPLTKSEVELEITKMCKLLNT